MKFFLAIMIMLIATPVEAARRKRVATGPSETIDCRVEKGNGYWQWRLIENRRCWYPGKVKLDKSKLYWSRAAIKRAQPRIDFYQWDQFNPIDAMAPERIEDIQKRDFDLRFKGTWDGRLEKIMPPYQK